MATAIAALENSFLPDFDIVEYESRVAGPPRCPHSLMLFGAEIQTGKSNYCLSCTPDGPQNTRKIVLPRKTNYALSVAGVVRANVNPSGFCPGCHSAIHEVIDDKTWKCAECGEEFRATRKS